MLAKQLRGECLEYPEYSTVRHFRLRGMVITLRFTNIEWSDQKNDPFVKRFTFLVDVVPDATVRNSVAELVQGPKPPKSCYP